MSRPCDPRKLAVWRERFERFSRSGLAVERFCAREGVSTASFYHWRKKLGVKSRRRRATERHARPPADLVNGRGRFQQVALVPGASRMLPTATAIGIQLPSTVSIFLYTAPTDMRKSSDGLSGIVRSEFAADPTDGSLFLFINRRRDRLKILHFDGTGYWLLQTS